MPIYEYKCRVCAHHFEFLLLPAAKDAPACPECRSADLEKLLSGFAVSTVELTTARVKTARAGYHASRNFKDQQVAEREHIQEHSSGYTPEPPKKKDKA